VSVISFALLLLGTTVPQEQTYEQRFVQAAKKQRAEDLVNLPELRRIGDEQRRRAAAQRADNLAREQEAWRYGQAHRSTYDNSTYDNFANASGYTTNSYGAFVALPVRRPNLILPNANLPVFSTPMTFPSRGMFMPRTSRPFSMRR